VSGASVDVGVRPPSSAQGCSQMRDAQPGPLLATSSKGRENSGAEKRRQGSSTVCSQAVERTVPGKDRARPCHRPAGWELRKGPVRVVGDRRMPAVLGFPQGQLVSSMEGTSGAADLTPLRGGAGDAALGSGCVVPACPCASVVRSRVACHRARPSRRVAFRARRSLPFAGVGLAWWDRERRRSPAGWMRGVTPMTQAHGGLGVFLQ